MASLSPAPSPNRTRFAALDVFRGLTIFLMILVNTSGPGAEAFPILVHARWIGFTAADLVFPTFLFVMGNAMAFALARPMPTAPYLLRLLRRSAIIFALGVLMYWFPFFRMGEHGASWIPFSETRIPGVLQRLALCYLVAGLLVRGLRPRALVATCAALLVGYWFLLVHFGLPGEAFSKTGNAGTLLDNALLPPAHLYRKDHGFDPEGLLGTLPATVNVLAGYLASLAVLRHKANVRRALAPMVGTGVALIAAGLAWAPWFPIAKKLWTGSFVLLTTGCDLVLLAALIWLYECRKVEWGKRFFLVLGRNPLAIYLFSELFVVALNLVRVPGYGGLYDWIGIAGFQALWPGAVGALLCALAYTLVCWALGWLLDRRGLILKV